jgi:hypothetical protein
VLRRDVRTLPLLLSSQPLIPPTASATPALHFPYSYPCPPPPTPRYSAGAMCALPLLLPLPPNPHLGTLPVQCAERMQQLEDGLIPSQSLSPNQSWCWHGTHKRDALAVTSTFGVPKTWYGAFEFGQDFSLEDADGSHDCWVETSKRVASSV